MNDTASLFIILIFVLGILSAYGQNKQKKP